MIVLLSEYKSGLILHTLILILTCKVPPETEHAYKDNDYENIGDPFCVGQIILKCVIDVFHNAVSPVIFNGSLCSPDGHTKQASGLL